MSSENYGGGDLSRIPTGDHAPALIAGAGDRLVAALSAAATATVQAAFVVAKKHPRSYDDARLRLLRECKRTDFADAAIYSVPRRQKNPETKQWETIQIEGESIHFVTAAVRCWGNASLEAVPVHEDEEVRILMVVATDYETNFAIRTPVVIMKTVERGKVRDGQEVVGTRTNTNGETVFIVRATDQELHEKTQAAISKAMRNNGKKILPPDLVTECRAVMEQTLLAKDRQDPGAARRKLVDAFAAIAITPAQLAEFLGHDTETLTDAEYRTLKGIGAAIKQGETTWQQVMSDVAESRAAFGATKDTAEARAAAQKRLAEARTTAAPEAYAAALKNCGIDDPAKAPLAQLEQALAILTRAAAPAPAATTAAPAAPAAAPAENPTDFAKRKAAGGAAPQGGAT